MKPVRLVKWDAHNHRHIVVEQGRCTVVDVEDILGIRCHPTRRFQAVPHTYRGGTELRRRYHGQSCRGRFLVIVAADEPGGAVRPITCWPLAREHLRRYLTWKASRPR